MTKSLIEVDDVIWDDFKKSLPRDMRIGDAVSLLVIHFTEMKESGKVFMDTLSRKYGIKKKEIRAMYLKVKNS